MRGNYVVKNTFSLENFVNTLADLNINGAITLVSTEDWPQARRLNHESTEITRSQKLLFKETKRVNISSYENHETGEISIILEKQLSCCDFHHIKIWISDERFPIFKDILTSNLTKVS